MKNSKLAMRFIKENLVLIAGITLPALLVVGFLLLAQIPRTMVDPLQYDFLVVGYRYDRQQLRNFYLNLEVKDGKLVGRATPINNNNNYNNQQQAVIFRFRANQNRFDEISYELPEGLDALEAATTFPIAETAELTLDKKSESPDGFTFEYLGYRGGGGLLGELFGMRRRYDQNYVLNKGGVRVDLPHPGPQPYYYYGGNLVFLGWVIADGANP